MKRKKYRCRKSGCLSEPYLGGLCRNHHDEDEALRQLRADALTALHSSLIDGELPRHQHLRDELNRLQEYWSRVCSVVQTQRGTPVMPLDEAEYAIEWCISLAQEIVTAQRQVAEGRAISTSLEFTQLWVWERLQNLMPGFAAVVHGANKGYPSLPKVYSSSAQWKAVLMEPSLKTMKRLFALCQNQCAFPDCLLPIAEKAVL